MRLVTGLHRQHLPVLVHILDSLEFFIGGETGFFLNVFWKTWSVNQSTLKKDSNTSCRVCLHNIQCSFHHALHALAIRLFILVALDEFSFSPSFVLELLMLLLGQCRDS